MAKRKGEGFAPPALGGSSLLVAFAVLALTVFALLSLSPVRADVRLGEAAAQAVQGDSEADCEAQEILARLRNEGRESLSEYRVGESYTMFPDGCKTVYSYAVPISDTQELQAAVVVNKDGGYEILRWQAVPVGEWKPDDSLTVWDGEQF